MKITFSNISLILGWWHWHLVFWVPFRTCLFSVLYLKFEIGCSLVRCTSWAESPRLSVWCACLVLHFWDPSVSCSLCFFFLSFFRISAVIWVLYFFLPHNCCSLIIPVLKEWVRIPGGFAEVCSTWGSCALSQWPYRWSPTGTWTNWSPSL